MGVHRERQDGGGAVGERDDREDIVSMFGTLLCPFFFSRRGFTKTREAV